MSDGPTMRTVAIDNMDEVAFQSETAEEDCLRHIGESFKRICVLHGIS